MTIPNALKRPIQLYLELALLLTAASAVTCTSAHASTSNSSTEKVRLHFLAQVSPEVPLMRARTGHLLARVKVEEGASSWFIVDSGAAAWAIDRDLAQKQGLKPTGEATAEGAGGSAKTQWCAAKRIEIGPAVFEACKMVELDLSPVSKAMGVPVGGICGFDFFAACVVELELEAPSLRVFAPDHFELKDGSWQKMTLHGHLLCVNAKFEGHTGLFRLDTGAGQGTVLFHSPAVRTLRLTEGRKLESGASDETLGTMHYEIGQLADFELANKRFESPTVGFSTDESGAMADSTTTGTLMHDFLTPFKIVFDVGSRRIAFLPRDESEIAP